MPDAVLPARSDVPSWLAGQDLTGLDEPAEAARAVRRLVQSGALDRLREGSTAERFQGLSDLGRADLVLARLAEGHLDAATILVELGGLPPGPDQVWGVWAADPPHRRVTAQPGPQGWTLNGTKGWCSGAAACTHALVSAHADDGYRLFAVELTAGARAVDGSWPAVGMAGSDSREVLLDGVVATPVGGPGDYLDRDGFWPGGAGVAAVWIGGAHGVADALAAADARRALGPHALAHAGAVDGLLAAADALLSRTAALLEAQPHDRSAGQLHARRLRDLADRTVGEVVDRVGRALGAGPLCTDRVHARRVADLTVYVRQSHAERDAEALGRLSLDAGRGAAGART